MKSILTNLSEVFGSISTVFAIVALILFIIVFIKMKKIKFTTKMIAQVGIAVALATVLGLFKVFQMPQGGSITIGSMVPVILIALFYGPEVGFLTGFLVGLINLIISPYILHPVQVLFDYPLPFMALGLAGYFKNNKYLATVVAILGRYLCHIISGVVFFSEYAGTQNPIIYSILYNLTYLAPDAIVCFVIMALLPLSHLKQYFSN
ncbi:MAG: energy-coupled thiamine transporter ThiT [Clostridiaceae bacterium]